MVIKMFFNCAIKIFEKYLSVYAANFKAFLTKAEKLKKMRGKALYT